MKEKLIIEADGLEMKDALQYASVIVSGGRISGSGDSAQYCYLTVFKDGTKVSAFKNKASDRLSIWRTED
jgi:hypothetical protein